jgi:DNA mismatch repair protein MSH5
MIYLRDGFNVGLDSLRDVYDSLDSVLTETAHAILLSTPLLSRVSVEYVSQIGYLAAVDDADCDPELLPPSDFEPIFAQNGRQYFKHAAVRALDDRIGDIHSTILDTQKVLLRGVEDSVLDLEPDLQRVGSALADVDALLALGIVAAEMDFVRPDISEEPIIAIKQGRHPLQELTVDIFVPNDTLVSETSNVGVITGPNGSGKSVYVKQVGVLVYLAHIGSWLPCEKAIIGLTDKILTRIESVESVTTPSSSFALDLTQMNRMLATHTQRSLCLVDEFGKGTAPIDGIAMLATIIAKFVSTKTRALFVLHFTEVLDARLLGQETLDSLSVFRMETVFDPATNPAAKHILHTPVYKLGVGICEDSQGMACAKEAGVPDEVLERSYHIKECMQSHALLRPLAVDNATAVFSKKQCCLVKAFLDLDLQDAQPDLTSFFAAVQSIQ